MSADNEILIRKKKNGLYEVRHMSASSLIHALNEIEPTFEELTLSVVADNIETIEEAYKIAEQEERKAEEDGYYVEYGIRNIENEEFKLINK